MRVYGDRDNGVDTTFSSEDAMCRWLLAKELRQLPPRPKAVLHASAITHTPGPAIWQVSMPEHSLERARGIGMIAVVDTSGLFIDPKRGAAQITILDVTTGAVLASWLPPHGVAWARFEGRNLVVDGYKNNASICEPLTGRVIGSTEPGLREKYEDPLLPNVLHASRESSRLESPDGALLWSRPSYVRSGARRHGLSIIAVDDPTVVEAVRDDGTTVWTTPGSIATVTADTVWVDAIELAHIVDIRTGTVLSSMAAPWGSFQLWGTCNGWDPADDLVLISDDLSIAAYPGRAS